MLINPEDGQPANYILEELPPSSPNEPKRYRLIGIDNDHSFGVTVAKKENEGKKSLKFIEVKTLLFCLKEMNEILPAEVHQHFKNIAFEEILPKWLEDLGDLEKGYQALFTSEERQSFLPLSEEEKNSWAQWFRKNNLDNVPPPENKHSYIGVAFNRETIERVYNKFKGLQNILKDNREIKPLEILKELEAPLASKYDKGFAVYPRGQDLYERFDLVDGEAYHRPQGGGFYTSTRLGPFLRSSDIPLAQTVQDLILQGKQQGPAQALIILERLLQEDAKQNHLLSDFKNLLGARAREEFLKNYNFKNTSPKDQRDLLNDIKSRQGTERGAIRRLNLKYCSSLTGEYFKGFEGKFVTYLGLQGCSRLTEDDLFILAQGVPSLRCLNLSHLQKLVRLGNSTPLRVTNRIFQLLQLKTLIITNAKAFEEIYINGPQLKEVKLQNCPNLQKLILETPQLQDLDLRGNASITDEALNKTMRFILQLKNLYIEGCDRIQEKEFAQTKSYYPFAVFKMLPSGNKEHLLKLLRGEETIAKGDGATQLVNLKYIPTLRGLDISSHPLALSTINILAEYLKKNTTLTTLNLLDTNINSLQAPILIKSLQSNQTLTELTLEKNRIGPVSAIALAGVFKTNTSLKILNLRDTDIRDEGAEILLPALQDSHSLTELDLGGLSCGSGAKSAKALVQFLKSNKTLTAMHLVRNAVWFANSEAKNFMGALAANTTLRTLNLGWTYDLNPLYVFKDEDIQRLGENCSLTSLSLRKANINTSEAKILGEAFKNNTTLTELDLYGNRIDDIGVAALLIPLFQVNNTTLKKLDLGDNGLLGSRPFADLFIINQSLTTLRLDHNKYYSNSGNLGSLLFLTLVLRENKTLTEISLCANHISDADALNLAAALKKIKL
ncbi:hypothetical protein [Candidatus Paracaedibacter symbiosus]|uniref:hypothetical protein n=1 Tax=Candidatus Paracaedibacter symbiosus TaxID=244582 RepID=UPI001E6088BD|nr:hypothetical protein [Candidatus Paracaedibacter symbiosus]